MEGGGGNAAREPSIRPNTLRRPRAVQILVLHEPHAGRVNSGVGRSNSPRRCYMQFPCYSGPVGRGKRTRFMCSVSNEAVLKALFKYKRGANLRQDNSSCDGDRGNCVWNEDKPCPQDELYETISVS